MDKNNLNQIGLSRHLTPQQWRTLVDCCESIVPVPNKTTLSERGTKLSKSLFLVEGFMGRFITYDVTDRKQLVAVEVPGDFVDFHAYPLKRLDHDVVSLSDAKVAVFDHVVLQEIFDQDVELCRTVWFMTLIDASIQRHWTYRNAAMRALPAIANLLCEFRQRLMHAGMDTDSSFELPIQQSTLALACGLSVEHVSRVMRDLREGGYCSMSNTVVQIHDLRRLEEIAQFRTDYLCPSHD
ncbi:Crp/Fnr family transcriptional regulator [Sulfitobacter sp. S190]|uniref:Crp/Fnr family transcriptional regulator n=1 Tax=Sulfitobacter sp. S190 TaxID=2867022 RepID=UPI0021A70775|nr:Crp/Fnr family transcriptional regulator [Sulfitobacter sp. S190]UWR21254.1 Crp/Fnr family transcriptional regulator [Sulfitobacter sp. S190]